MGLVLPFFLSIFLTYEPIYIVLTESGQLWDHAEVNIQQPWHHTEQAGGKRWEVHVLLISFSAVLSSFSHCSVCVAATIDE